MTSAIVDWSALTTDWPLSRKGERNSRRSETTPANQEGTEAGCARDGWTTRIARDVDSVRALRPCWELLSKTRMEATYNTDIDWYLALLSAPKTNATPYVIEIRRGEDCVLLGVCRVSVELLKARLAYKTVFGRPMRTLSLMEGGVLGDLEDAPAGMLACALENALTAGVAEVVYVNRVPVESPLLGRLGRGWSRLYRDDSPRVETHWRMRLPEGVEGFLSGLSSVRRRSLRRALARVQKEFPGQVKHVELSGLNAIPEIMSVCSGISRMTYKAGLGVGFEDSVRTRWLMEIGARHNWLRAHVLWLGARPCAFLIALQYGKVYFLYASGYDPRVRQLSPGTVLSLKVLEVLCARRTIEWVDFGCGEAEYKEVFCDEGRAEASLYLFAPRVGPVLVNVVRTCVSAVERGLRGVARRVGVDEWVKRRWRARLEAADAR